MKLSNTWYDICKYIVMIALPALSVLYVALAGIWGWPYATEVQGTIDAVTLCMATMLMISTAQYNKKVSNNG